MKPAPLLLFASLLLVVYQFGCDRRTDTAISQQATPTHSESISDELPQDQPIDPNAILGAASAPPNASLRIAGVAEEAPIAPTYIVIQNAAPTDPQLLVRQLQQVLPKTQIVKQVQSPDTREIKLEVSNIQDVRALANMIPFGSIESVDVQTRTITVDFDL